MRRGGGGQRFLHTPLILNGFLNQHFLLEVLWIRRYSNADPDLGPPWAPLDPDPGSKE